MRAILLALMLCVAVAAGWGTGHFSVNTGNTETVGTEEAAADTSGNAQTYSWSWLNKKKRSLGKADKINGDELFAAPA